MTTAYIGLGANLGDPRAQLLAAFDALDRIPQTRITGCSSLYRTAPVDAAGQPDYVNAVARVDTGLPAAALLAALRAIEDGSGRARPYPNAPRTLDLDLLLYGATRIDTPALTVPHPRMHQRAFVLVPLAEIDPGVTIPGIGPAAQLLAACSAQAVERLDG